MLTERKSVAKKIGSVSTSLSILLWKIMQFLDFCEEKKTIDSRACGCCRLVLRSGAQIPLLFIIITFQTGQPCHWPREYNRLTAIQFFKCFSFHVPILAQRFLFPFSFSFFGRCESWLVCVQPQQYYYCCIRRGEMDKVFRAYVLWTLYLVLAVGGGWNSGMHGCVRADEPNHINVEIQERYRS